jgi:outer membrane protein OmpA-like peptidoglycan-associated protein
MTIFKALGAVVGLFILGACTTHAIDDQLGPVEQTSGQGSAFAQNLHTDYGTQARVLQASGHLSYAQFWSAKSARAATGEEVLPENPDVQGMHPADLAFAKQNQARLNAQLAGNARTRDPVDLAIAQVSFDCMVIHWEKDIYGQIFANCWQQFQTAMGKLEVRQAMVEPPAHDFWLYFDFGKFNIRADASRILDSAVNAINGTDGSHKVTLVGHTDTVGSTAYNQKLSEQRAASAQTYLLHHGVSAGSISTVGKGKTDLRIQTPDQVREQENRNVHIEIQ